MSSRSRWLLAAVAVLCLCVPAGFAIAGAVAPVNTSEDSNSLTHEDPDPSSDPQEIADRANKAYLDGDQEALRQASEEMRTEMQSRMTPADRKDAQAAAANQVDYPKGTHTYLAPTITESQVESCKAHLANGDLGQTGDDSNLCRLIILNSQGKIRSGAYTVEQEEAALKENER